MKTAELVSLKIDGTEISVPPDTSVIEAAEAVGVLVPRYCYHPGIPTRPAQCRVCLVEIEGQPKLQPSCKMSVQEGMVVHTASEEARSARRSVIELLLVNHPLDCPICDAAGQCMLQDYAFETHQLASRLNEEKLVMGRDRIADDILYFADRCIICTRCVRFMREVAEDDALIVAQRGYRAYIDTFPGRVLDNPFRGNIVDVCPVGALVHEDFLFKARFWDLDQTASVCPGCSTGCNVTIDTKENQIVRLKPRHNSEVNSYWMCDHGRKHLIMSNRGLRPEAPLLRRNGKLVPTGWGDALTWVAERLREVPSGMAIVSPHAANESLFYFRRLLDRIGIAGGTFRVERGEEAILSGFPKLQLRADRAPNASGAELHGFERFDGSALSDPGGDAVAVLEDPLAELPEEWGRQASFFLYVGNRLSSAARNAHAILPVTTFAEMEGTFTNFEGRVQRFHQALQPAGLARPAWLVLARLVSLLEDDGDGGAAAPTLASEAFQVMVGDTPAMAGLEWASVGLKGARLGSTEAAVLQAQAPVEGA
ncbi:MAG: (2Fe-2S)-binding protein [Gemmatimonadetes bacterium]|nr:(2Fe-2S)-binding protein [Gemmatimonadota bacterium]